ncbi:MAG: hypothetical protein Q9169_007675 [Polycauliona sp. 2 TL-2023]
MSSQHQTPDGPVLPDRQKPSKQVVLPQQSSDSSVNGLSETAPETDAIEDIFRLFVVEVVEQNTGAHIQATEQQNTDPNPSMSSCNDKSGGPAQEPRVLENTDEGQKKHGALTEGLEDRQYRVRPFSG